MKVRIIVGAVLAAFLLAVLHFGGFVFLIAISLFAFAATYETAHITTQHKYRPLSPPAYVFALGFPFVYHFAGAVPMFGFYLLCIVAAIMGLVIRRAAEPENAIISLLLFAYPLSLLICALLVYVEFERPLALTASAFTFAAPACTDAFAYFGGTLFGKRRLCEKISPKKTVEGAVAGLLGGLAFGAALIPLQKLWGGYVGVPVLLLTGLVCGVCAQFGDLFASMLKRWAGVKDFSSVFPAHGGIMDRIDSILLCAPVVLCLFTILRLCGIY